MRTRIINITSGSLNLVTNADDEDLEALGRVIERGRSYSETSAKEAFVAGHMVDILGIALRVLGMQSESEEEKS